MLLHRTLLKNVEVWINFGRTRDCRRCNHVTTGFTRPTVPFRLPVGAPIRCPDRLCWPPNILFFAYPILFPLGKPGQEWSLCTVRRLKCLQLYFLPIMSSWPAKEQFYFASCSFLLERINAQPFYCFIRLFQRYQTLVTSNNAAVINITAEPTSCAVRHRQVCNQPNSQQV